MIDHSPYDNMEIPSQLSSVVADALACGQGKNGSPENLGLIGRAGHAEHDARGADGAHIQPDEAEQAVIEEKKQQKHGNAAEEPHIKAHQHGGGPWGVHLRHRHGHAEAEAQRKRARDENNGDQRPFENIGKSFDDGG